MSKQRLIFPDEWQSKIYFFDTLEAATDAAIAATTKGMILFRQQQQVLMSLKITWIGDRRLQIMLKKAFNLQRLDIRLLAPMIMILIIGYIMIFSTTSFKGLSEYNDAYFFIKRHSIFLLLGICLFFIGNAIPTNRLKQWGVWGYGASILLLLITIIPGVGVEIGGARRWLMIGGFQFQPVEVMKFWWAVAVSIVIANKTHQLSHFKKESPCS